MNISSISSIRSAGLVQKPASQPASGWTTFKYSEVLTSEDMKIVNSVSPPSANTTGLREINRLEVFLAFERVEGTLRGEIDATYATNLKQRLTDAKSNEISVEVLDKLIAAVSGSRVG